jgi:hypothetical protein
MEGKSRGEDEVFWGSIRLIGEKIGGGDGGNPRLKGKE